MSPQETPPNSGRITDAMRHRAAEWIALCEGRKLTAEEEHAFTSWIEADPRHRAAFMEVTAGWARLDGLSACPHCEDVAPDPDLLRAPPKRQNWTVPVALAASIALIGGVWLSAPRWRAERSESSSITQIAPPLLRLSDGSEVELNADAEVRELFTATERRVSLLRGEAHFNVVKDAARPFIVEAGNVTMRAVGTAFNVRLDASNVELLVTHGRVEMTLPASLSTDATTRPPVLEAHQRVLVPLRFSQAVTVETLALPDVDRALAWQTRRIAFDNQPLEEIIAQFQRPQKGQSVRRVTITDPRLKALRITGRVRADDLDGLVEVLEASFNVAVDRRPDGEIVLRLR